MRAVLALGLWACGKDKDAPGDGTPATGETGTPQVETGDSGTPPPTCDDLRRARLPTIAPAPVRSGAGTGGCDGGADVLEGTLTDLAGGPLAGIDIKFCNDQGCRIEETAADGSYCYADVVPADYAFVPVPPEGSGLAHALTTFVMAPGQVRTVDAVVPPLEPSVTIPATAAEFEAGAGFYVTIGAGEITPPDPFTPDNECLAGVQVPSAAWPVLEGLPGTPVAVWYVDPFDFDAPGGLPFRIEDQWASAEGKAYDLWVGSYGDFGWLEVGTLTASGGWLTPDAGVALPLLSTFVLVDAG